MLTLNCLRRIAIATLSLTLISIIIYSSSHLAQHQPKITPRDDLTHVPSHEENINNETHSLIPRGFTCIRHGWSDSREFNVAMEAGDRFMAYFAGSKPVPAVSNKYSYGDLEAWGWTSQKRPLEKTEMALKPIEDVINEKKWSTDASKWIDVEWTHSRTTMHGKKTFVVSLTELRVVSRNKPRLFISDDLFPRRQIHTTAICTMSEMESSSRAGSYGPTNKAPNLPTKDHPPLHHWSDITFLQLSQLASAKPSNLKNIHHILRYRIQTPDAIDIILGALKHDSGKTEVPPWPGHTFKAVEKRKSFSFDTAGLKDCSHAYRAMIGLPHVTGVAWLLLQHKEALGKKAIGTITVFDSDKSSGKLKNGEVNLLVEIVEELGG